MEQAEHEEEPIKRRSTSSLWHVMGRNLPRSEIVFFTQMLIIAIVIAASIYNLTLDRGDSNLWTALLSSSLGYILPNPSIRPSDIRGR